MGETLLQQALCVPAAAGLLCWVMGRPGRRVSFWLALLASAWTAWAAWQLFRQPGLTLDWPWFDVGGLGLGLVLKTTRLSGFIGFAVAGFTLLMVLYSYGYLHEGVPAWRYYAYMMWTLAGALTALYADHLLLLLIGWEIVSLMLYLLVNLGGTDAAAKGAMKSFAMLGLADCAMLASLAMRWARARRPGCC
jgi:NADH:ubiquinone oxidoreductase subunit 5 (subunit L)/multisubunit Na+/H+ antiporter MnhA subunit